MVNGEWSILFRVEVSRSDAFIRNSATVMTENNIFRLIIASFTNDAAGSFLRK